ncbi:vitamin K epoxide reductase family protein [Gordonia soli]|uniref:vitamin K epoxide reductase family protein n=1 Tax=Gordonia soli TaxID=320799 RepID=UPI00058F2E35|nr:vitamin K epoxide reductase family protein [Gordonia soli]
MVAGIAGLAAAAALTIERFELLVNPSYVPSCSINPILSCGSVMVTDQASVFGFPNPIIGIAAFSVVVTTGILSVARVSLPRWYWVGLFVGALLGLGFVGWLISQSLYEIHALCPYCMVVWTIIMPIVVIAAERALHGIGGRAVQAVLSWRWIVAILYYAVVVVLIFLEFQDYWISLVS